ncbi:MAG: hypothetical protein ABMA02_03175 [Saprospiraceae bacterium]
MINTVGHDCNVPAWPFPSDITNVGNPFAVAQHGTFRFPYDQVGESVQAALPGWTLLIHTGTYPEKITIAKPLTLKAEGGPVTIGH